MNLASRLLACGATLLLLESRGAIVAAEGPNRVSMVVLSPDSPEGRCAFPNQDVPGQRPWWVAVGGAKAGIRCGIGTIPEDRGVPLLIATGSVQAHTHPEGVLQLEISVSVRRLSALRPEADPSYDLATTKRSVFLSEAGDDAFLPILVASGAESERLGLQEVLLRLEALGADRGTDAVYGQITVTPVPSGHLVLDGGVVGKVTERRTIRNVLAGERELETRDPSAREVRRMLRVPPDRRILFGTRSAPALQDLVALGKNPQGFEEHRRATDDAVVVTIPAGEFLMGNHETERTPLEHRVHLSSFRIDKTEVTWRQYERFLEATGTPFPPHEPYWGILDDHPASFVTWDEARAYCAWAGARLPTEAEWEKGARGTDDRKYPWGSEEPDPERSVNRRSWGFLSTDPVASHPSGASPSGLLDMGGNVWEWCEDWYDEKYYEVSPARDPRGPLSGQAHVVRGGSWDSRPDVLSCSCRGWGHRGYREGDFGFRCAMTVP